MSNTIDNDFQDTLISLFKAGYINFNEKNYSYSSYYNNEQYSEERKSFEDQGQSDESIDLNYYFQVSTEQNSPLDHKARKKLVESELAELREPSKFNIYLQILTKFAEDDVNELTADTVQKYVNEINQHNGTASNGIKSNPNDLYHVSFVLPKNHKNENFRKRSIYKNSKDTYPFPIVRQSTTYKLTA